MIKRVLSYSGVSIISALIPFLCLPFITRLLSVEEYAEYAFWYAVITVLSSICLLGAPSSYTTYYSQDKKKASEVISFLLSNNLFIFFVMLFFTASLVFYSENSLYILSIPIFVIARSLYLFYLHYCRVNQKLYSFIVTNLATYSLVFLSPIFIMLYIKLTGLQVLLIMGIVMLAFLLLLLWKDRQFPLKISPISTPLKSELYQFGLYSGIHSLMASLITISDRVVLKGALDSEDFAIYALAATLVSALSLAFSKISQSFSPELFAALDKSDNKVNTAYKYFIGYVLVIFPIAIIFYFSLSFLVTFFFTDDYIGSVPYAQYLLVGVFFQSLYFYASQVVFYLRRSNAMFWISVLVGVLGLLSSITLCFLYGIDGVIFSFIITWFVYFIITLRVGYLGLKNV